MTCIINKFITDTGQYRYACVVLIVNLDIYANPGIILSESLKKLGCLLDFVALVDDKISLDTIELLKNFFNKIIKIEPIKITHKDTAQSLILSKINIFNLIEYDWIFLVDVDTIFFTNPNNLILKINEINKNFLYMVDMDNYGLILIKPDKTKYDECKKIIEKKKAQLKNELKPFAYIMRKIYPQSNVKLLDYNISYDSYSNTDCIQYRKDKPFLMTGEISIEQRQRLNHFKIWFSYFTNITNKYPAIKKYSCVSETIQVSKYFLSSLSRFIIDFAKTNKTDNKLSNITNIYGIDDNYKNIAYYHLDITREYVNKFIKYDVNTLDMKAFLEYVSEINYKPKHKLLFNNYYKYTSSKLLVKKLFEANDELLNIFLNSYVKIFPNVFITMEINPITQEKNQTIADLENNLVFEKEFILSKVQTQNMLFNLNQNFTYEQRISEINKKITHNEYIVRIGIYEMIDTILSFDDVYDLKLFIFYESGSKIRLSSIFFNPNTLNMFESNSKYGLNIFDSEYKTDYLNLKKIISQIHIQTLKKYIYSIYSGDQINNLGVIIEKKNKFLLIDNNKHSINKIKTINANKVFFITIIFTQSSQYKNILSNSNIDVDKIYNPQYYWELDGIKILLK